MKARTTFTLAYAALAAFAAVGCSKAASPAGDAAATITEKSPAVAKTAPGAAAAQAVSPAPNNAKPAVATPPVELARPTVSIGHTQEIKEAHVSPDGQRLFTMDNGNLRVWDVESTKELKLLKVYDGGNTPWTEPWNPLFIEERKWLLVPRRFRISVFNYETLEELPQWSSRAQALAWDAKRQKLFFAAPWGGRHDRGRFVVGEFLDSEKGVPESKLHAAVSFEPIGEVEPRCQAIVLLQDGRVLLDTNFGYAIVDLATGLATRPDQQPEPSALSYTERLQTVAIRESKFRDTKADGMFYAGPEGTVLRQIQPDREKHRFTLELRSGADFSLLRSNTIETKDYLYYGGASAYDPKTKSLRFFGFNHLYGVDFESLAIRETIPLHALVGKTVAEGAVRAFQPIPNSTHGVIASAKAIWKYDLASRRAVATFGDRVLPISRLVTAPDGFEFLASDQRNQVKRVRVLPGGIEVTSMKGRADGLAYDPQGESIAHASSHLRKADINERAAWTKAEYSLPQRGSFQHATGDRLEYSEDGSVLAMHSYAGVAAISTQNGNVLLEQKLSGRGMPNWPNLMAISPDNRWVVAYDGAGKIVGYDLSTGKPAWEQPSKDPRTMFFFIGPDTFCCQRAGDLEYRAADTGRLLMSNPIERSATSGFSNAISRDRKLAATAGGRVVVFDPETGKAVYESARRTNVLTVAFFPNPRFLVTVHADNLIRFWDTQQPDELCTLALFEDNNDWVVSTPELRFDASENAIDKMYVVKGSEIIPLESLFEKLYTPKLLGALLGGEKFAPPAVDLHNLRPAPVVKLELAEGTRNLVVEDDTRGQEVTHETLRLRAVAEARDSTVGEIRLFQNGKLITTANGAGARHTQSFETQLVPGENVFRAVALNAERTESRAAELIVTYRAPKPPAAAASSAPAPADGPGGLQLHLLIVGVNTYQNTKYNLNYAVADATAVKQRLEAQTKSIFTAVNVRFILNEEAQKSTIADAFRAMAAKAGPRDVFVFYYAGHGVMTSDAKPEFFLVPHDVTQLYGADDALRQKGLASAELMELSKLMPAQKQLFILDACQSAGALKSVAMRGAAEEKAIAQLARSTGTHWLTASGSEQFATEFDQLGHGAFTYALLEGLSGKADGGETGDGRITVNELKAWLETQVPEITLKHKGTPQYPSSYGFGQDFPIVVIQ